LQGASPHFNEKTQMKVSNFFELNYKFWGSLYYSLFSPHFLLLQIYKTFVKPKTVRQKRKVK